MKVSTGNSLVVQWLGLRAFNAESTGLIPGQKTKISQAVGWAETYLYFFKVNKSESEIAQLCPTLRDLMDCSLPVSSVYGIFQARILEWVAISFSRGSSWPRDQTRVSHIAGRCFTLWATREATVRRKLSLTWSVQWTSLCYSGMYLIWLLANHTAYLSHEEGHRSSTAVSCQEGPSGHGRPLHTTVADHIASLLISVSEPYPS